MTMKKFKEIIFLKNLKRVGKATIYKTYWDVLNESKDFDDLILKIEKTSKFSKEDIDKAIQNASDLFDYVNNDEEIHVITVFDDDYPEKLMVMENKRPLILYVKGNVDALTKPNISVIGTRKPSEISQNFEKELVEKIAKTDRVVVSGLALGCDAAAHRGCMAGDGGTIAIVATGLDIVHPYENIPLQEEILRKGGLVLSEQPLGVKANPTMLVAKNRLQAALSEEVVVAECPIRSGTMHTVRFAQKYGKTIKAANFPYNKEENSGNKYIITTGIGTGI